MKATSRGLPPPRNTAATRAAARERRIVELWLQRPKREQTSDDVEKFYGWLVQHEPDLIPSGPGSLRQLRATLKDHIVEPAP